MSYHYEIIKDTEAYKDVYAEKEMELRWNKNEEIGKKICEFLGVKDINNNLYLTGEYLMMTNPPEYLNSQFKKPSNGRYTAKKNSQINKDWIEFCKTNNLRRYDSWWVLTRKYNFFSVGGKKGLTFIDDRCFIETEREVEMDFLISIPEEEYLKARIDYLEKHKKEEE